MLFIVTLLLLFCSAIRGTYVVSWGSNSYGQLGIGNGPNDIPVDSNTPRVVVGYTNVNIKEIRVGLSTHFGMAVDGTVYCSGNNIYGQLGINNLANQNWPVKNSLAFGLDVYPIGPQTIAYNAATKDVFGWGLQAGYMLGKSFTGNQLTPRRSDNSAFAGVVIGVSTGWATAFVMLNGGAFAAGKVISYEGYLPDTNAKLGLGVTTDQLDFTRVSSFPLLSQRLFLYFPLSFLPCIYFTCIDQ
jgi:alpha-tubulin suppressor-like RCC1 family protein